MRDCVPGEREQVFGFQVERFGDPVQHRWRWLRVVACFQPCQIRVVQPNPPGQPALRNPQGFALRPDVLTELYAVR